MESPKIEFRRVPTVYNNSFAPVLPVNINLYVSPDNGMSVFFKTSFNRLSVMAASALPIFCLGNSALSLDIGFPKNNLVAPASRAMTPILSVLTYWSLISCSSFSNNSSSFDDINALRP